MDEKFIAIYDWMVEDLKLSGHKVLIYAVIYSFSKDGEWFQGSLSYLSKRTGASLKTVVRSLNSLCDEGYIQKRDRPHKGIKYVDYQTTGMVKMTIRSKCPQGMVKMTTGVWSKWPSINKKDNKKIINNARARENKFHDYPQRTDTDYDRIEDYLTGKISNPSDKESDDDIQSNP